MVFGAIGGALAGAAGNAGVGFLQGMWENTQAKKAATTAYNRNISMWEMENEYNNPKNQMQRLRDAGLNPQLALGGSNTGGTMGGVSPAHTPNLAPVNPVEDFYTLATKKELLKQAQSQTQIESDNIIKNRESTKALENQNVILKTEAAAKQLELQAVIKNRGYNPNSIMGSIRGSTESIGGFLTDLFRASKTNVQRIYDDVSAKQRIDNYLNKKGKYGK